MEETKKTRKEKKFKKIKVFSVPFDLEKNENIITITTNISSKLSKEQIINQAYKFHTEGNILEAAKYYKYFNDQGFKDPEVFSNYGVILKNLGKLKEAELFQRKAIKLNPDFAEAYSNLGNILRELGKLNEAELSQRRAIKLNSKISEAHSNLGSILIDLGKLNEAELSLNEAIKINPNLTSVYYTLSKFKKSKNTERYKNQVFSKTLLNNKTKAERINLYFARANILQQQENHKESAKYLLLANNLKVDLKSYNANILIEKSQAILRETSKELIHQKIDNKFSESIFIVGMPRSGSTLVESILSINPDVYNLGEINILEESFLECKKSKYKINLAEQYRKKIHNKNNFNITTNKWLYNYQYTGIIAKHIPNARIIHCHRNPLDNILSIYRTHFIKGNEYSSSLVDCARVYLDQEEIMTEYKQKFRSKIYDLDYDSLVINPKKEIKSLISWLGWKWDNSYLYPHLSPRSVSTASSFQVRSPINSKSIDGWKKYRDMLKPAIEILHKTDKYKNITS